MRDVIDINTRFISVADALMDRVKAQASRRGQIDMRRRCAEEARIRAANGESPDQIAMAIMSLMVSEALQ